MIIDTSKYPISLYSVFLIIAITVGFTYATILLVKHKTNKIAIACSALINGSLLMYLSFCFTTLVNLDKGKLAFGFTSMGGVFGVIIGSCIMYLIFKDSMLVKAYIVVLPLIYSIAKIGCFFGGCCVGHEYSGIFSVNYLKDNEYIYPFKVFPVQLLETLCFFIIFIIMRVLFDKIKCSLHLAINGILCSLAKFTLDFLRDSHTDKIISINQILCLITLIISVIFLILGKRIIPDTSSEKVNNIADSTLN